MIDWLSYLRRLVARKSSAPTKRPRPSRRHSLSRRPTIELLEDRWVPASLVLSNAGTDTTWLIHQTSPGSGVVEVLTNGGNSQTILAGSGNDITINPTGNPAPGNGDGFADHLIVDFSNGFFQLGAINFNGGDTPGFDRVTVIGNGVTSGTYAPSAGTTGNGTISVTLGPTTAINFTEVEANQVSRMTSFTLTTPNSADNLTIGTTTGPGAEPANIISGMSGATLIQALTFFDVTNFVLDASTNDTVAMGSGDDTITVNSGGFQARNLQTFAINTGNGNDILTFQGNNLATPLTAGGSVTFNGGVGLDTVNVTGDGDYALSDTSLQSVNKGSLNMTGVEVANITGGASNNVFNVNNWNGIGTFDGLGGTDRVILTGVSNATLTNGLLSYGAGSSLTLMSIEEAGLTASAANSNLDASAFTLGAVTLTGGLGSDTLKGGSGNDFFDGGSGNDSLVGGDGNDVLHGGTGNDSVSGGVGNDSLFGEDGSDTLNGGIGNDNLDGGNDNDSLDGGGGNDDTLNGGAGNDSFSASGTGDFSLKNDQFKNFGGTTITLAQMEFADITGSASTNFFNLTGWTGSGSISGTGGNDRLIMYQLADATLTNGLLTLGTSATIMLTGISEAELGAGNTNSKLDASAFSNPTTLTGGTGDDLLKGGTNKDSIFGGLGNDTLSGGTDNDTLSGGPGTDRVMDSYDAAIILLTNSKVEAGTEVDTLSDIEQAELTGGGSNNRIDATGFLLGPVTLNGAGGNDTLVGTRFNDSLVGEDGDDNLDGRLGNDILSGGAGNDTVTGGKGVDRLVEETEAMVTTTVTATLTSTNLTGDFGMDVIAGIESASLKGGDGNDVLDASGFKGKATLNGGAGNDLLKGGQNDDSLNGGAGNDSLEGNGGNDVLTGGADADTLDGGAGKDMVFESEDTDMTLTNSSLSGSGIGANTLTSIERALFTGGSSGNILDASGFTLGPVTLNGMGGNDQLKGGSKNDSLDGGAGNDTMEGNAGNDELVGDIGDDSLIGGAGADNLNGGAGNDTADGGGGNDRIVGDAGNDNLSGGGGTDKLVERGDFSFTLTNTSLTGAGTDVLSGFERVMLVGGASANTIDASAFTGGPVTLRGGGGNDTLRGTNKGDLIFGESGNDRVVGNDGNDKLDGGSGLDTLNGGLGEDTGTNGETLISVED